MEEFDYKKKKKRERYYIKFSFYGLLVCGIIIIIWGLYHSNHQVKILQYGENALGIIIGKGYGKTSKKSASSSYYVRFECVIDSVRYNMIENISKEGYDTIQIGQTYIVKYLSGKNPVNNSKILLNRSIKGNAPNRMP